MRVFIGIELPDDVKQSLLALSHRSVRARWQDAGQLHLTLNFIGEARETQVRTLCEALRALPFEPLTLRLAGVGTFGSVRYPKALWAGVEPEEPLQCWHQALRERLIALGLPQESRAFRPHVTLARFGRKAVSAEPFLNAHAGYRSPVFPVTGPSLFVSHLSSEGARYEVLEHFPVG